jgi:hypothetical protein
LLNQKNQQVYARFGRGFFYFGNIAGAVFEFACPFFNDLDEKLVKFGALFGGNGVIQLILGHGNSFADGVNRF